MKEILQRIPTNYTQNEINKEVEKRQNFDIRAQHNFQKNSETKQVGEKLTSAKHDWIDCRGMR